MRSWQRNAYKEKEGKWYNLTWLNTQPISSSSLFLDVARQQTPSSDFCPDFLSRPSLSGSTSRPSAEPSWILRTTATRLCRRPPPTSTPATPGPRKQRMMGRCPVTPSGCGSPYWPRLATLWWWRWFVSVPSERCGSRNTAAAGWRGKVYSLKIYFLYKWCKIALLLAF